MVGENYAVRAGELGSEEISSTSVSISISIYIA